MEISLTKLHKELARHLLWRLANNPDNALITYGELCSLVDNQVQPRACGNYLGALSEFCFEYDMPLISAIVTNKEFIPGAGFYGLYRDLTVDYDITDEEIFSQTYKNVVNFQDWGKLAQLLGLESNLIQALNKSSTKSISMIGAKEGEKVLKLHLERERNSSLSKLAKKLFIEEYGELFCELCDLVPSNFYEGLKCNIIHAHHIHPLGERDQETFTSVNDFKMLCANCHTVVHQNLDVRWEKLEQALEE
ncbi:HNH endonuclease [Turicibacter sanguinis]|uniref:HNH endonuclease n=1 Tax=Turicibacter sanguinis TaxID=154288 RepID=UPI00232BBB62|nr:hypothetical protein [Turicibacter sanguinis]MDB8460284.1 hypothetical protein [Turicibacter sanguinis]